MSIEGGYHFNGGISWDLGFCPRVGEGRGNGISNGGSNLPEVYIDEAQFCGKTNQIHGAVQIQFAQDVGPVVFNGLLTD